MTLLSLLTAASAAATPTRLDPVELFLEADIVVQAVMAGLLLASVWVWMIIVSFSIKIRRARRQCAAFEAEFWDARDIDAFYKDKGQVDVAAARVIGAGLTEWRRSTRGPKVDREGTRARLAQAMELSVETETDRLAETAQGVRDDSARARDAVSGVDINQEAAELTRLQAAYRANAQVIAAARDMLDTLLGIAG